MAFVSGDGMRPGSSSNGIANGIVDQQAQSQDASFRASLQQHLLALQQQQQPTAATVPQPTPQATATAGLSSSSQLGGANNLLYQQLLAQQLQQPSLNQSQLQAAPQSNPQLTLQQQQLAALQNLQGNPSATALLQQQLLGQQPGAPGGLGQLGQPPAANNGVATALAALIATNPTILQALTGATAQPNTLALLMQLLAPNAASSLLQPQQQSILSLIQLLTNLPGTLLNYPGLLPQPQVAQPAPHVNQLAALTQLLGAGGANTNWNQIAAALGALPTTTTTSTDENRAYLDQLLQQVHGQQQAQAPPQPPPAPQPVNVSTNNTPRLLSAQNSSNSLLSNLQQQHAAMNSNSNNMGSNQSIATPRQQNDVQMMDMSGPLSSNESNASMPRSTDRQPSAERLLNAESVQDHISRLISENEAIVEPNPVLLKRRPYNRTNTSNSIASQSSMNDNGSQRGSPSIRSPGLQTRVPTTRSQSLHEASMLNTFRGLGGGSLTSGQPVFRQTERAHPYAMSSLTCNFCGLKFPNEAGLEAHEFRCSKKEQLTKQHSQPQLQLNSISSQAQAQQQTQLQAQLLLLQQQKLIQAHQQANSAFMAASAAGIAAEASGGRSSAPLNSNPLESPGGTGAGRLGFQPVSSGSPTSINSGHPLKKRLLEGSGQKEIEVVDVVTVNEPQTAKMPKMEPQTDILDAQRHLLSFQNDLPKKEDPLHNQESHHFDQPSSSNTDPNAILLRQLTAQQELAKREIARHQEPAQQSPSTSHPPQDVQPQTQQTSTTATTCPKGMGESIGTALLYIEAKVSDKMPYVVTLSEQITASLKNEGAPPTALCATPYRNRMRNITQDTFVCLHRPQPMFVLQKKNLSMYSNWQQVQVSPTEASLIQCYFKTYSTKPRMGTKELYRFTLANKDRGQLRLTHSTFWMLLNKHRLQTALEEEQQPPQTTSVMENFQNYVEEATNQVAEPEPRRQPQVQTQSQESKIEAPSVAEQASIILNSLKRDIMPFQANLQQNPPLGRPSTDPLTPKENKGISLTTALAASRMKPIGGLRVDEVEVYIRGRGRGRYVCERCGIRCKKPSMLKKHLRSHTNIRPFSCITCNFSFKTKGNLTKHLMSKAHRRRLAEKKLGGSEPDGVDIDGDAQIDEEEEDRLIIDDENQPYDDPNLVKLGFLESKFMDDEDRRDDDEFSEKGDMEIDEVPQPITSNNINYRRYGQEDVLFQRVVHTPPTIWMRNLCDEEPMIEGWSPELERYCNSAPPAMVATHGSRRHKNSESTTVHPQRFASIPSLNMFGSRDDLRHHGSGSDIQQNFLIADISPPASADASGTNYSNSLIANFIPFSKQPQENDHVQKPNALYFLQGVSGQHSNEDASTFDAKKISSASMEAFLANEAQDLVCDMCDKKFRKESDLLLHKQTHLIERQQNARARTYQCPECKTTMRSKQVLLKHIEQVHDGKSIQIDDDPTTSTSTNSNPNASIPGFPTSSSSNPSNPMLLTTSSGNARSFVCKDCNLGFRTHGVLAKHLRSKNHVKNLTTLGRLPEDAPSLIKENSNLLASVDATDSESAFVSLSQIIASLKGTSTQLPNAQNHSASSSQQVITNDQESSSSSLECREQLGAQSPGPQTPNGFSKFSPSVSNKIFPPLPVGIKRKNERTSPGDGQSPPARRPRCDTAPSQRPSIEGIIRPVNDNFNSPASVNPIMPSNSSGYPSPEHAASPLHSLATIATASRNAGSPSVSNGGTKTMVANVWIPPRLDQLDRKAVTPDSNGMSNMTRMFLEAAAVSDTVASSRSSIQEDASEGRSEASTPVQRGSVNGHIAASPMPQSTRCNICEVTFETPCELQVHLHADHIVMRDGRDFKCPKRHCEKVYPSKDSLRTHIMAHYYGGGATPTFDGREDNEYSTSNHIASSPSDLISGSPQTIRKPPCVPQHQSASFVPNNSPDAPEESNTAQKLGMLSNGMRAPMFSAGVYSVPRQSPQQPLSRPKSSSSDIGSNSNDGLKNSIPCAMCGQHFPDAAQLQCHWVSDHMPQMNSRPFVCKECDAGFPSKYQLDAHIATHAK